MLFKIGDRVVYPGHGVAKVEEVIERRLDGQLTEFYKLNFEYKDMAILVPRESLETCRVRYVSDVDEVRKALEELKKEPCRVKTLKDSIPAGWSKRQKEYQHKLESGSIVDVAAAYRDLRHCSKEKQLSFGEKGLMLMAENLLSQELQAATEVSGEESLKQIRNPFEGFKQNSVE